MNPISSGGLEDIRPVDLRDPSSGFSGVPAKQDHKHKLDPTAIVITRLYTANLDNGTNVGAPVAFDTHLNILSSPCTNSLTMIVTAIGYVGFNAVANQSAWHIFDEAGVAMTKPVGGVTIDNPHTGLWQGCSILGSKNYVAGATPGFTLRYNVGASNVYARMGVRVDIMPIEYTS